MENAANSLPSSSRYRVIRCIATGGMGAIYLGVQRGGGGFARRVAIKRAHAGPTANAELREAILTEARNGSLVRHPNVVSIDDVEESGDELLLVMDYIDGGTLGQLMSNGRLPIGVVIRIILDACAGLDAIHNATDLDGAPLGLVHRDVSPQNILLGLDGVARIADFGIAKGARDKGHTGPMMRRGKFGYMSPEYIKLRVSSASSDMFALGIVFWEALAGRRLFEGTSGLESIKLAMAAEVPSLRGINPMVSSDLDGFVQRALSRSPLDRFATMRHFGDELEFIGEGLVARRDEVTRTVARSIAVHAAMDKVTVRPAQPETLASLNVELEEELEVELELEEDLEVELEEEDLLPASVAKSDTTYSFNSAQFELCDDESAESRPRPSLSVPMSDWERALPLEEMLAKMTNTHALSSAPSSGTIVAARVTASARRSRLSNVA